MATWMGHLRAAEILLESYPDLDRAAFVYGSLAPDFGRPLGDNKFSPPKEVSHRIVGTWDKELVHDLAFYRDYMLDLRIENGNERYSFLVGYFFHLVMDGLWSAWIGQACKRDFAEMLEEMGEEAWWEMKDDWYGLDVQYARDNKDSLFWTVVMDFEDLPLYLDFQDKQAVDDQVRRIQKLNSDPPQDLAERNEFPYLSAATMERYISDSVAFLLEYWQLLQDGVPEGTDSFRELFPAERFVPYEAPLGEGSK